MAAEGGVQQFNQISLGSRGGVSQGQLKLSSNGFIWRGANKTVEVKKDDVDGLFWTKAPRGCQLGVRRKAASTVNFLGFRDKDLEVLGSLCQSNFGKSIQELALSMSGRNWGNVQVHGSSLSFMVDGKVAFEVPLPDVSVAEQQKGDVVLELHVDDTTGNEREDTLAEIAFYVPPTCEDYPAEGEETSSKVLLDSLLQHTDAGAGSSEDPVVLFSDVAVLAPRGRFEIELFPGHLVLTGQNQEYKVRYPNIQRVFVLPKTNPPNTLVIISLDPPIRKGHTYYAHLQCQFPTDEEASIELDMTPEAITAKNEKTGKPFLQPQMSGSMHELFVRVLRGLSGCRMTKPGLFRNNDGDGCSVRCSYKADDGQLYPLDKAFFYVHKPPLLIAYEDVDSVEFARQASGVLSSSVRTFDLVVRTRSDQEHQFRNISRTEWHNLFEFINARKLRIENLAVAQSGPGAAGTALDLGDELDPGMRRAAAEVDDSDDDDGDFKAGESDDGSEDDDDSSDAEMIDEEGISAKAVTAKGSKGSSKRKAEASEGSGEDSGADEEDEEKPAKKSKSSSAPADKPKKAAAPAKEKAAAKEGGSKVSAKGKGKDAEEGGAKAKKPRKKKDPNAPKAALSAFMYFSSEARASVKKDNPGIAFGEVGRVLGERWKALSAEDKAPYNEKAAKDKLRYQNAMAEYKASGGGGGSAGGSAKAEVEGSEDEAGDASD